MLAGWLVLLVAFLVVYWGALSWLVSQWIGQSDYVYGFLIIPFSLYMLWERREIYIQGEEDSPEARRLSIAGGIGLILFGVLMRVASAWWFFELIDRYSIIPTVAGITLLAGGWRWASLGLALGRVFDLHGAVARRDRRYVVAIFAGGSERLLA